MTSSASRAPLGLPGQLTTSAAPAAARDTAREHAEAASAFVARGADRLGETRRGPLDHNRGALGREVARTETGTAGGDDETGEVVGELAHRSGDRLDPVGNRAPFDDVEPAFPERIDERIARAVFAGAGDDAVGDRQHLGPARSPGSPAARHRRRDRAQLAPPQRDRGGRTPRCRRRGCRLRPRPRAARSRR